MSNVKFYCPVHKLMFVCVSGCCEPLPLSNGSPTVGTKRREATLGFLKKFGSLNATTITIGEKWIGKLSADQQYKVMAKDIRIHMRRYNHSGDNYYYYCFELQKNGQLHAHGIEAGTYSTPFIEMFERYGKRNRHKKSFTPVSDLDKYFEYITKECTYPTITNITLRTLKDFNKIKCAPPEGESTLT